MTRGNRGTSEVCIVTSRGKRKRDFRKGDGLCFEGRRGWEGKRGLTGLPGKTLKEKEIKKGVEEYE